MCLGIPGRIVEIIDAESLLGVADISGVRREVSLACIAADPPEALLGCWALVHVGFAMSVIDEAEAHATLAALEGLGEVEEARVSILASAQALADRP